MPVSAWTDGGVATHRRSGARSGARSGVGAGLRAQSRPVARTLPRLRSPSLPQVLTRIVGTVLAVTAPALWGAEPVGAQDPGALAGACAAAQQGTAGPCTQGAAAAHALQAGFGLLLGAGGPFTAAPNTAGQRLHGSPRFLFEGGFAGATFTHPELAGSGGSERRRAALAPRATVGVGVFEGLSPAPTMGGVGALDLLGEVRLLPVPSFDGLEGRAWAVGVGARVGVFRESFSLPGVTLSAVHRRSGSLDYAPSPGAPASVSVEPRVTSFRGVVGKDLMEVGISGGVQWDRIRGEAGVQPRPGGTAGPWTRRSLPVDRTTWFLGVNRTWVVSQAALELGWSPGPGSAEGLSPAAPAPGGGLSGALTFRVRY